MKISQVALQLYTLRDHCQTAAELASSMKKVREIGYRAVQISGIGPISVPEINEILGGEGLQCCATHESGEEILSNPQAVVERLASLNCKHTAYPYPGGVDFGSDESIRKLVEGLDAAGSVLREAGQVLNYHNHSIEFVRYGPGTILDFIYANTRPENLKAELDTYWVQYGGANPADWCEKMAGRLSVLHLKDYSFGLDHQPTIAEIGSGNIDFKKVIASAEQAGCEWFVVEQDVCPGDPFVSVKKSFDYIQANLVD